MTGHPPPYTLYCMPPLYPRPLATRKARREHNQYLVGIPPALVAHWAIGEQTQLFWTLLDENTVVIRKLVPAMPGRPLPHDDPRRTLEDVAADLD